MSEASPEPKGNDEPTAGADDSRQAGRGGIAIAGAKLYFMVVGLVQQIALKHLLGLNTYGALGKVQGLASVLYNPVITTDIQGVSRAISGADDADKDGTQRRVLAIHGLAIVPVAIGFFVLAPTIASWMKATHLVNGLRVVASVMLFYGLYAPFVGALNGRQRFGAQAGMDALAATLRTIGLLGGAWYFASRGTGMEGALGGFAISAGTMVLVSAFVAGVGRRGRGPTVKEHLIFVAPLFFGQLALNLLFQSDFQLLGRFSAEAAIAAGDTAASADTLAGAYRNAQLFCFLPYQLLMSVTFVLFPLVASARRDGDGDAVARYVRTGVRLALVLAGAMVSVTAGLSEELLNLVFGQDSARVGGPAMPIMALGQGAFAIFGILATVLTSLKRERISAALTTAALTLVVVLCFVLVRGSDYGPSMLVRTAIATSVGLFAATLLAAFVVRSEAGAVVAPLTLLRVLGALGVAMAVARLLPDAGKLVTVPYAAAVGVVYAVVLIVTRELGRDDLALVARVLGRKS